MRSVGHYLLHHTLDLRQLVHQIDLIVQTSGCIDDHDIDAVSHGRTDCVISHRSRIATHLLLDDRHSYSLGPDLQLLYGRSTEGIGSPEHDALACLTKAMCQFADGSGLAYAVYAHYHDYIRFGTGG